MVKSGECPPPYTTLYAYANSLQRTVATARFFITSLHSRGVMFLCITGKKWALWTQPLTR